MDRRTHVFDIALNEADVGRVIGKNGQTIAAIRNLIEAAAYKNRERVTLNVSRHGEGEFKED